MFFLFVAVSAFAQQSDTTKHNTALVDTLHLPTGKIDSATTNLLHKADSLDKKLRKLQSVKLTIPPNKKTDSVRAAAQGVLNKPTTVEKQIAHKLDSINPEKQIAQYNQKIQVFEKHFTHHLDSLGKLNIKDPRFTKSMDSLKGKLDSLKNSKAVKDIQKAEQQLAKLQSGINSKVKGFEGKVTQELGALNKVGGTDPNIPNVNVPNLNIPNVGGNLNLPNTNLGTTELANVSAPSLGAGGTGNSLSLPNTNTPTLNTSAPSNLTGNILPSNELSSVEKEVTQATGEVGKVEGEAKNMNSSTLEKDVENTGMVKQLGGEIGQTDQYKKMVEKWQSDPAYMKELAVTQAKQQAMNHFAGQEKQLAAAMQQLTNVKTKYKGYEGALDMFKKPGNPMKGKPFMERLRPGLNVQFQSKKEIMLDINPQVGYRLSGKITIGMGWNMRMGYDFNKWSYVRNDYIYGPRGYAQVKIKTGIYAMIAPEMMNALVPPSFNSTDIGTRKWVWSWMAGMKKEFQYGKNLLGNMQFLYNLLDKNNQSPYVSKLNIRMGLEFPLKKKRF